MPASIASAADVIRRAVSATVIVPLSAAIRPNAIRISVVFPAPFSPTSACTVPARTENDTSSSAVTVPKCFEIFDNARAPGRRGSGRPEASQTSRRVDERRRHAEALRQHIADGADA